MAEAAVPRDPFGRVLEMIGRGAPALSQIGPHASQRWSSASGEA